MFLAHTRLSQVEEAEEDRLVSFAMVPCSPLPQVAVARLMVFTVIHLSAFSILPMVGMLVDQWRGEQRVTADSIVFRDQAAAQRRQLRLVLTAALKELVF